MWLALGDSGFTGDAGSQLPAVWLRRSGGWRIWGGTITNPDGFGILVNAMPGPVVWTGFTVKDTGDSCVAVYPADGHHRAHSAIGGKPPISRLTNLLGHHS